MLNKKKIKILFLTKFKTNFFNKGVELTKIKSTHDVILIKKLKKNTLKGKLFKARNFLSCITTLIVQLLKLEPLLFSKNTSLNIKNNTLVNKKQIYNESIYNQKVQDRYTKFFIKRKFLRNKIKKVNGVLLTHSFRASNKAKKWLETNEKLIRLNLINKKKKVIKIKAKESKEKRNNELEIWKRKFKYLDRVWEPKLKPSAFLKNSIFHFNFKNSIKKKVYKLRTLRIYNKGSDVNTNEYLFIKTLNNTLSNMNYELNLLIKTAKDKGNKNKLNLFLFLDEINELNFRYKQVFKEKSTKLDKLSKNQKILHIFFKNFIMKKKIDSKVTYEAKRSTNKYKSIHKTLKPSFLIKDKIRILVDDQLILNFFFIKKWRKKKAYKWVYILNNKNNLNHFKLKSLSRKGLNRKFNTTTTSFQKFKTLIRNNKRFFKYFKVLTRTKKIRYLGIYKFKKNYDFYRKYRLDSIGLLKLKIITDKNSDNLTKNLVKLVIFINIIILNYFIKIK